MLRHCWLDNSSATTIICRQNKHKEKTILTNVMQSLAKFKAVKVTTFVLIVTLKCILNTNICEIKLYIYISQLSLMHR